LPKTWPTRAFPLSVGRTGAGRSRVTVRETFGNAPGDVPFARRQASQPTAASLLSTAPDAETDRSEPRGLGRVAQVSGHTLSASPASVAAGSTFWHRRSATAASSQASARSYGRRPVRYCATVASRCQRRRRRSPR
jgi:hypothetical protein